jgi:hypothetical protein
MIILDQMKYKAINDLETDVSKGDILDVVWHIDIEYGGDWALYKDGRFICDLTSYNGTHFFEAIEPAGV